MTREIDAALNSAAATTHEQRSPLREWLTRIGIVVAFFAAVAPTLRWLDFSYAEENVVVATAMEMHRTGNWLVPTLQGKPRTIKPPLAAWMAAAAMHPKTLADISSADPNIRDAALSQLGFEARWPAVLLAGLMLVGVYDLGRAVGGHALGLVSACVCGTTWFFLLHQGNKAANDLPLAAWVTCGNAFLAHAILRGRRNAWVGAGIALGLAMMSKGPVGLLQTIVPAAIFAIWARRELNSMNWRQSMPHILAGAALMLAIGLWWYGYVAIHTQNIWHIWFAEVTRYKANDQYDPPHSYIRPLRLFFPWLAWMVVAMALVLGQVIANPKKLEPIALPLLMAIVPFAVMFCFRERKERYLTPLVSPASVVTAWLLVRHITSTSRWSPGEILLVAIHWIGLAIMAIGLPIIAMQGRMGWTQAGAKMPVIPSNFGVAAAVAMSLIIVAGIALSALRWRGALVGTTVAVMLVTGALFQYGFAMTDAGHNEMRPIADALYRRLPDADIFSTYGPEQPGIVFTPGVSLAIYLNKPVVRVENVASLPPPRGDRPQALLAVANLRETEPMPPSGWRQLLVTRTHNEWWKVFVR